jgi:hypothetical protein
MKNFKGINYPYNMLEMIFHYPYNPSPNIEEEMEPFLPHIDKALTLVPDVYAKFLTMYFRDMMSIKQIASSLERTYSQVVNIRFHAQRQFALKLTMLRRTNGVIIHPKPPAPIPDTDVGSLEGLSNRVLHVLKNKGLTKISDLLEKSEEELLSYRGFGKVSLACLNTALAKRGLSLKKK